jgi:hypothetical protein
MSSSCAPHGCTSKCSVPVTGFSHVYDEARKTRAVLEDRENVPRSELVQRDFLPLALDLESRAVRSGRRHPFIRMGRIAHSSACGDALQLPQEDIKHRLPRDERRRAERNGQHIACSVIITTCLFRALGYLDPVQRRHSGRREIVEHRVDMPAVEPCDRKAQREETIEAIEVFRRHSWG